MAATTFSPLRQRLFAMLLAASLVTHLGNAAQAVGAQWAMTAAGQGADVIALVQSATNLPIMLLALPAGAMADLFDRRAVLIAAASAMFVLSGLLMAVTAAGAAGPAAIIALTALLACGIACFGPAMAASIGGVVPRAELAAAVALNILAFNVARSVGPALGGGIVAIGGAQAAFAASAVAYLVAVAMLRRSPSQALPVAAPRRSIGATILEGLRYAAKSPPIRTISVRALSFTLTGCAAWALMPLVARDMLDAGSIAFGLLLGALGLGAVLGAASSTALRARFSSEALVRAAGIVYGAAIIGTALAPGLPAMLTLLVIAGAAWVQALSGFAVAGQLWAPRPLVGRVTALVSSLTFGGIALGSWAWGHFAEAQGVAAALIASGAAMILLPLIGLVLPMPSGAPAD
ncbi:MFS transporter [Sphingomonas baiyangensis]|uniref:MFS transporter n=1 Tax=Sphingomonas baiyangensis TaxID=2572576 RepID=A0A4U1L7I6_9SPHN|nr:MFS transporter [Sphingomonas baiyangensis]TKD52881.1 MFS transporter [Sphingomonas baiyangensis]